MRRPFALPALLLPALVLVLLFASFHAAAIPVPTHVETLAASGVDDFDGTLNGHLDFLDGAWAHVGFVIGHSANLTGAYNVTVANVSAPRAFALSLTNLTPARVVFYKAWARDNASVFVNGSVRSFTTPDSGAFLRTATSMVIGLLAPMLSIILMAGVAATVLLTLQRAMNQAGPSRRSGRGRGRR